MSPINTATYGDRVATDLPTSPIAQCVAIVNAATIGSNMGQSAISLMANSGSSYLLPAMSGIAVALFRTLATVVGEDAAASLLAKIGLAATELDDEIAELALLKNVEDRGCP